MEIVKTFTYWFVGLNVVATLIFSVVCIIFGARDLINLLRNLEHARIDDADVGRVVPESE